MTNYHSGMYCGGEIKVREVWFCEHCSEFKSGKKPPRASWVDWIDVRDRLPKEGKPVLVYLPWKDEIKVDYVFMASELIWCCTDYNERDKVTHWSELPNRPKNPDRAED